MRIMNLEIEVDKELKLKESDALYFKENIYKKNNYPFE